MKKQSGKKSSVPGAWEHMKLRQKHQLDGGICLSLLRFGVSLALG